jgi:hypothetical protein
MHSLKNTSQKLFSVVTWGASAGLNFHFVDLGKSPPNPDLFLEKLAE